jgi:hypothetical protein
VTHVLSIEAHFFKIIELGDAYDLQTNGVPRNAYMAYLSKLNAALMSILVLQWIVLYNFAKGKSKFTN